jgi:hypothetical protein
MHFSNTPQSSIMRAVENAMEKADKGQFLVCVTIDGDVLVLPEISVKMRNDIAQVVYDTDNGYRFATTEH